MNKKAIQKYPSEPPYPGVLSDGSFAPFNTDTARLDYISHFPGVLKNLKSGVRVVMWITCGRQMCELLLTLPWKLNAGYCGQKTRILYGEEVLGQDRK